MALLAGFSPAPDSSNPHCPPISSLTGFISGQALTPNCLLKAGPWGSLSQAQSVCGQTIPVPPCTEGCSRSTHSLHVPHCALLPPAPAQSCPHHLHTDHLQVIPTANGDGLSVRVLGDEQLPVASFLSMTIWLCNPHSKGNQSDLSPRQPDHVTPLLKPSDASLGLLPLPAMEGPALLQEHQRLTVLEHTGFSLAWSPCHSTGL